MDLEIATAKKLHAILLELRGTLGTKGSHQELSLIADAVDAAALLEARLELRAVVHARFAVPEAKDGDPKPDPSRLVDTLRYSLANPFEKE